MNVAMPDGDEPAAPAFVELYEALAEAVRLHGTDWALVKAHLQTRIAGLPDVRRREYDDALRRVLAFTPHLTRRKQ